MMTMSNKRVGLWSWALSSEEAVTAVTFGRARADGEPVTPAIAERYAAMVAKQQKLTARAPRRPPARLPAWWS